MKVILEFNSGGIQRHESATMFIDEDIVVVDTYEVIRPAPGTYSKTELKRVVNTRSYPLSTLKGIRTME